MFELTSEAGIARLVLSRLEARNAIPLAGWAALAERADQAQQAGARVLILAGSGGAFSSGADLSEFGSFQDDMAARSSLRIAMRTSLDRIASLEIPTLAVIEGACYGAGVALAMACDIRFAASGAQLAITPAKLGISFPQEDVHRLVGLVGHGQAARLLLGASIIDGAEAERIGLVERCLHDDLWSEVEELAERIAAFDPESVRVLKRAIRLAGQGVASDARQESSFDALLGSPTVAQRLAARVKRAG